MAKVDVLSLKGEKVKDINLTDEIWNIEPNEIVMTDAIRLSLASLRQGTAKTKGRSEVSGGGRKPWRQKGTGRARQGSTRATQWVGGGIAHGVQPRDYGFKINKKERMLAMVSALSDKAKAKAILVFDHLDLPSLKTKDIKKLLKDAKIEGKVLFITADDCENLYLASRNLANTYHLMVDEINVLDIVNADTLVLDEAAVKKIEEGVFHA